MGFKINGQTLTPLRYGNGSRDAEPGHALEGEHTLSEGILDRTPIDPDDYGLLVIGPEAGQSELRRSLNVLRAVRGFPPASLELAVSAGTKRRIWAKQSMWAFDIRIGATVIQGTELPISNGATLAAFRRQQALIALMRAIQEHGGAQPLELIERLRSSVAKLRFHSNASSQNARHNEVHLEQFLTVAEFLYYAYNRHGYQNQFTPRMDFIRQPSAKAPAVRLLIGNTEFGIIHLKRLDALRQALLYQQALTARALNTTIHDKKTQSADPCLCVDNDRDALSDPELFDLEAIAAISMRQSLTRSLMTVSTYFWPQDSGEHQALTAFAREILRDCSHLRVGSTDYGKLGSRLGWNEPQKDGQYIRNSAAYQYA